MKLLKLIPAAAIALTAFMSLEGKTEQVCMYNNASYVVDELVVSGVGSGAASKNTSSFSLGITKCIKLGDVPIQEYEEYKVQYSIQGGLGLGSGKTTCDTLTRMSYTAGETHSYEVTGTTTQPKCSKQ